MLSVDDYAGWAGPCNVYACEPHVFVCPTDSTPPTTINGEIAEPITYFYNLNLSGANAPSGMPRSALISPAVTIIATEESLGYAHDTARIQDPNEIDSPYANSFAAVTDSYNRHQGGRMFLLADGHARWLRPTVVSTGDVTQAEHPDQLSPGIVATFNYN